jgi:hypothetical protein
MGLPVVAGDIGGPYVYPSVPPLTASFPMTAGSVKTFFNGKSVMLLGQALTGGGPIITATLFTTVTFVEGKPVLLGGAVTNLGTGWLAGVLQPAGAPNVITN